MLVLDLVVEKVFSPQKHVEKILGKVGEGDVTVACWDPGQCSPNHGKRDHQPAGIPINGGETLSR